MAEAISNSEDVIDSRDVIKRIEELESELQDAHEANTEGHNLDFEEWLEAVISDANPAHQHELWDEATELRDLRKLQEEAEGYAPDWQHGATLIRESYFQEYAEQMAEDIGAVNSEARWPNNHIDWKSAAEELKQDYTEVDFDGVAYLIR